MCVYIFVHFSAFLYKATTLNHKNLRCLRTETPTENYWNSMFLTETLLKLRCSSVTLNTSSHSRDSGLNFQFNFFNGPIPQRCLPDCSSSQMYVDTARVSHQIVNDSLDSIRLNCQFPFAKSHSMV